MFSKEKYAKVSSRIRNFIDLFLSDIKKSEGLFGIILFGSVALGLEDKRSDVDLTIILSNDGLRQEIQSRAKRYFPDVKFELHFYPPDRFYDFTDFVVIDSLLNGIPCWDLTLFLKQNQNLNLLISPISSIDLPRARSILKKHSTWNQLPEIILLN